MFVRNRLSAVAFSVLFLVGPSAIAATELATPPQAAVGAQTSPSDAAASVGEVSNNANSANSAPGDTAQSGASLYGIGALWHGSDVVAKSTLLILLLFSIGSWYIIIAKLFAQYKLNKQARATDKTFWDAGSVKQGLDTLEKGTPFHFIGARVLKATEHHSGLLAHVDFNTWVVQSIHGSVDIVKSRLSDGLAFLATVGSTAPFVGLFGTVWGIYHALTAIGASGQASIDKVAGPVGEALIMTAIGLAVAVPAVLGYNLLVRRNKAAIEKVQGFGTTLHSVLLSSTPAPRGA
jgi:biopolymer transport protein ExbB